MRLRCKLPLGLTSPIAAALLLAMMATPLFAHPGHAEHGFHDGIAHPIFGMDHLLAMIAVGLLAVRWGGPALYVLPCTFLGSMLLGGLLAIGSVPMPGVEYGIAASVLVLGVLIAATKRVPLAYGAVLVAVFAIFHGHAHAAEMAAEVSFPQYAAGFLLSTALLHLLGVVGGLLVAKLLAANALRVAGGAIALAGLLLMVGWV